MNKRKIWITWEVQRRSFELAKILGAKIYVLLEPDVLQGLLRYTYLSIKTMLVVIKENPNIIFVQNPSMVLASLLSIFRRLFGYKLVVDRHSNFKFHTIQSKEIKWKIFHILSRYTIRKADLTIVTNEYLCDVVHKWGGRGFILQDKLPELILGEKIKLDGKKNIVFISTFSKDEPIAEVIDAAKMLNKDWILYITGKYDNYEKKYLFHNLPPNIRLTNFLSEKDYQSLLVSADLLVVLTKGNYILNCGAYEAVTLLKPVVLSDTETIKDYFKQGVVFSKCDSPSIANAITKGIMDNDSLRKDISILKEELSRDWGKRFGRLLEIIDEI
jgi:glycosyltransferase involved in cell wall biosynthesis